MCGGEPSRWEFPLNRESHDFLRYYVVNAAGTL
jgi:hypothetical protein